MTSKRKITFETFVRKTFEHRLIAQRLQGKFWADWGRSTPETRETWRQGLRAFLAVSEKYEVKDEKAPAK